MGWGWFSYSYWFPGTHSQNVPNSALFYPAVDSDVTPCHYRIPAVYTFGSYVFALCEQRLDTAKDYGRMNIGMRKSDFRDLEKRANELQWSKFYQLPPLEGYRTMNPCPVGCKETGKLYVLVSAINAKIHEAEILKGQSSEDFKIFITSTIDFGESWTAWKDITYNFSENMPVGSKFVVIGPGHGVELQNGRLVVPGYFYRMPNSFTEEIKRQMPNGRISPPYNNVGCSFCLISDDKGETWNVSMTSDNFTFCVVDNVYRHMGECAIAETVPGKLLLNSREYGNGQYKILAQSDDGGVNWKQGKICAQLRDPTNRGCKGGLAKLVLHDVRYLIASNCGHPSARKNLTLWISQDDGITWSKPWNVRDRELCGYSDIDTVLDPSTGTAYIAVLYETGVSSYSERIDFILIKFNEILEKCSF